MIVRRYLKSYFIFDFMACVPVLIYEASYSFSNDFKTVIKMIDTRWYNFWSLFKVFKFLHYLRIKEVLTRFFEKLDNLFPLQKILVVNIRNVLWSAIRFCIATHVIACLFIIVSYNRIRSQELEFIASHGHERDDAVGLI